MKEATGELNATVFVITVVGFLMAFFYFEVWPLLRTNFNKNANCSKAICETTDKDKDGYVECHLKGDKKNTFKCVYKG